MASARGRQTSLLCSSKECDQLRQKGNYFHNAPEILEPGDSRKLFSDSSTGIRYRSGLEVRSLNFRSSMQGSILGPVLRNSMYNGVFGYRVELLSLRGRVGLVDDVMLEVYDESIEEEKLATAQSIAELWKNG